MPGKPNVVLVLADQWRPDALSVLGHPDVQTPCIDALAADGMVFNQTATQSPVCVPARMSFLTGRYPHQLGIFGNEKQLWPEDPNFVRAVRDAGYTTANRGKLHLFWRHDNELLPILSGEAPPDRHRDLASAQIGNTAMCRDERHKIVFDRKDGDRIEALEKESNA